jgi:Protein of unknown function (DUF4065)
MNGFGSLWEQAPSMVLDFNIRKSKAAAAYLIERGGGCLPMFHLIKMLYYADRTALITWGNSITGDSFASMSKGPIVSQIYDFLKDSRGPTAWQSKEETDWRDSIRSQDKKVSLVKDVDKGVLSEREIDVLENSWNTINSIPGSIADWLHKNCPEWEDPGSSSIPIDPGTILRTVGKTDEEIVELDTTNNQVQFLNNLLNA